MFLLPFFDRGESLIAQPPDTLWTKTIGGSDLDGGESVQQTFDGGYIIAGRTYSLGAGSADVWLIKTDGNGDTLWTRTFGQSPLDRAYSVQQTYDSGYVLTGYTESFGAGPLGNLLLVKTDSNGDSLWLKTFGGSGADYGYSVQQTLDGGFIIVGRTFSLGAGSDDVWLIKTTGDGITLWTKTFGGNGSETGRSVRQTSDSGYIIAGRTTSFSVGSGDVWLIKTDSDGDTLWTKTFGGGANDEGTSVQQTSDGGYIIAGYTASFGTGGDMWLIKTDETGDTLWTKTFGGSNYEYGYSVCQTSDGGYIMTGVTGSFGSGSYDVWLIRTDAGSNTLWTKTLGGTYLDYGFSVLQTSDGGYIVAGEYRSSNVGSSSDVWLIRVAADVTGIDEEQQFVIDDYELQQNYPNPFNPSTLIRYQMPEARHVSLKVYDVLGKEVTVLVDEQKEAGFYEAFFDAASLSSGLYFCRMQAGDFVATRKLIVLK